MISLGESRVILDQTLQTDLGGSASSTESESD